MYRPLIAALILLVLTVLAAASPTVQERPIRSNCPEGYGGTRCDVVRERLQIHVSRGYRLPDTDNFLRGNSDPYVEVTAYDHEGNTKILRTSEQFGTHNPTWNEMLDFGVDTWKKFTVQVWDEDPGSDDALSNAVTYNLNGHTLEIQEVMNCYSGYIVFDIDFDPDIDLTS